MSANPSAGSSTPAPAGIFYLVFTISGFAGLIYESIWTQYLKLFLGHAAYAQTLVLALFMGGMALGAGLCSRYADSRRDVLMAYAIAEAVIGMAALVFHPLFVATTGWAYDTLLPALGAPWAASGAKWTLAALLILPQSILLGTTFPLMSAGLLRRHTAAPGRSLAMLYFTNSLGAAIGVLASGFLLVEHLGLPGTIRAAGVINIALAAVVVLLARGDRARAATNGVQASAPAAAPLRLFLAIAFLTGAASFMYEIGWIRMLTLVLGASTQSFELMLSAFILGLALGGLWIRRRIDQLHEPSRFLGWVQIAMGLAALATVPIYGRTFDVMAAVIQGLAKTESGHVIFLASSHAIALAIMLPATFCAGMTLPLITYALLRSGHGERAIGAVYSANTLGSIVGVMTAAHVAMPLLGLRGLIAAGAVLDVALGLVLLWRTQTSPRLAAGAFAACAAAFAVVLGAFPLDQYRMASGVFRRGEFYTEPEVRLVMHRDGKTTTVSLMDFEEGRSLRTNGKSDGAIAMDPAQPRISDEVTMVLTGALPLAFRPDARKVAVIGIGTGLTTHTLLAHPGLESVETVEIEPAMAEASRQFAPFNANTFADPRSHIVFDDAKTYFSTRNGRYDIIISEPSNPWVSGVSSLFTREFYRLARRYLAEDGVLAQWFQLYEIDASLVASVLQALGDEFPDYAIYATTSNDLLILAGSSETLSRPLADITRIPSLAQELRRVQVESLGDIEVRRIGSKRVLAPLFASYGAPANSDYAPYLDLHAAKHRFLQSHASEITELGTFAVPVVAMLEGRGSDWRVPPSLQGADSFDKIEALRRAYYSRGYLLGKPIPGTFNIPSALEKDLQIARQRPVECSDNERFNLWFHSLFQVSRAMSPLLPARDAEQALAHVISGACTGRMGNARESWIRLLAAVARRDATAMAALGEHLLDPSLEHSTAQRQYLLMAAMTGYLANGERDKAAALWQRHAKVTEKSTDLDFRLLRAHALQAPPLP